MLADSLDFCKRLVAETGLGLAPGIAFGPEGEGFLRWCFASSEARLADGVERLQRFLGQAPERVPGPRGFGRAATPSARHPPVGRDVDHPRHAEAVGDHAEARAKRRSC